VRYRAFAIDLDGTLLTGENVPQANITALRAAHATGIRIFIATARWKEKALEVQRTLGISDCLIACSGAQVYDPASDNDVFAERLPADFTEQLFDICNAERCIATVTLTDAVYLKLDGRPDAALMGDEMSWVEKLDLDLNDLPRTAAIQGTAAIARITSELAPRYSERVNIFDSIGPTGRIILTITAKRADKGTALEALCTHTGIAPEAVVAFGDAENDLAMFRFAGAAVAMGQANAEVRAAADFVSLAHDQAGVGHAVMRLLAKGEF